MCLLVKEIYRVDKIFLNKMQFYGYHGVFSEENKLGQPFEVDLTVEQDLRKAGQSDDLEATVNYAELFNLCKDVMENRVFKLVEAVAETIASEVFEKFSSVEACTVKIYKKSPPINGHYDSVGVEIQRSRS